MAATHIAEVGRNSATASATTLMINPGGTIPVGEDAPPSWPEIGGFYDLPGGP